MRIVVDAMAASYGGLSTYARGLLRAWTEVAPQDELTVLVTAPFGEQIASDTRCSHHRILLLPRREPPYAWRLARTEIVLPRLQAQADILLATLPTIPALWRKPVVAVVHDLRHEVRPHDFPLGQRVARRLLYTAAYRRANLLLADSHRTANELLARHPGTAGRIAVVPLAADHVALRMSTRTGAAVAFGHFVNKDPGLLLSTWAGLSRDAPYDVPRLHIIGLREPDKRRLSSAAERLGISSRVELDGYLSSAPFDQLMATAGVLVLPSRYEGFGLPVLEAMRQGIPVVISSDAALREVAGGHAACALSWKPADLAAAVRTALAMTSQDLVAAQQHAEPFTWRRTVELTRANIHATLSSTVGGNLRPRPGRSPRGQRARHGR
jgi:glycosyltransferase involved in cell wall biosynthesis